MNSKSPDSEKLKEEQKKNWGLAAVGWKKWWTTLESGAQVISNLLVELARIKPGDKVMDVATGIGEPAVTAARIVGPSGCVVATDQSPQMLAVAQERARALELSNMEFREMDGELLDLPEKPFDAVLCRWGLMFMPDRQSALKSIRRHLADGGRFAAAVWDVPQKVQSISLNVEILRKVLKAPPPPEGAPGPFAMADTDALKLSFEQAGFNNVQIERKTVTFAWPSADAYVQFTKDVSGHLKALMKDHPPQLQAEAWEAVKEAVQKHAGPDGGISMRNQAIIVLGIC
ncbi:MAG: methyltransferase [bacterium]|nr:MAG: methyltransferase [bacterium]